MEKPTRGGCTKFDAIHTHGDVGVKAMVKFNERIHILTIRLHVLDRRTLHLLETRYEGTE